MELGSWNMVCYSDSNDTPPVASIGITTIAATPTRLIVCSGYYTFPLNLSGNILTEPQFDPRPIIGLSSVNDGVLSISLPWKYLIASLVH